MRSILLTLKKKKKELLQKVTVREFLFYLGFPSNRWHTDEERCEHFILPSQQPFGIRTDAHCKVTEACQARSCRSTHIRRRPGVEGRLCGLSFFYCCLSYFSPKHMLGKYHPPSCIPNLLDCRMSWAVVIES